MKTPFTALAPFFSQPTQAAPLGSIQSQIYQAFGLPAGTQFEKLQARLGDLLTTPNLHLTANTFQALSRVAFSEDISWGTLTSQDLGVLESFGRRIKSLSRPIEALAVVDTPLGAVEVPDLQQLSPKFGGFTPQSASVSLAGSTPARAVEKAKEVMELKSIPVPPGSPERKEIISQWLDRVAGEDATKKRPIQKILLACNGLAATRLVDGFNALSAEIAKDMMYNVADPLINMVAMAGPSDLESGASYLEKLSRETIEMVPENIQTEELDKNGKPISVRVFLHYETILACAKKYNVDAIAVGWGWVSEHAAFVQLAESRGFKVIAPPADAMEKLGGKIESKLLAESADVPVLPWTGGPVNTPADARKFAKENGYKVVIKATAGGGGRGIRIIKGISDPEIRYQDWDQPLETNEELLQTQYFDVSKSLKFLPNHYALQSFISSTVAEKRKKAKIIRLLKLLHQKSLQDQGEQSEEKERDRMAHLLRQAEDAVNTNDDEQLTGLAHELIRENHVVDLFFSAQNEGLNSFKDKTVFMELLAPDNARHIEVQVDADEYRGVRTLLERDCSLQLRRQKVSEEAPAIFVSQALRKAMREAAKRISLQAGYTNLGTCEFLCDGEKFWFMEMNTRLQVEHPVTEMLTGLDLVKIQLKNAMGIRKTPQELSQWEDVFDLGRHVMATRITAKDPDNRFAGSAGSLSQLKGAEIPGTRTYFSIAPGGKVPPTSDPQFGHTFSVAPTRGEAIALNYRAQEGMLIDGDVKTTVPFTMELMGNPDFQDGHKLTIGWLQGRADEYETRPHSSDGPVALMSAALYRFDKELMEIQLEHARALEEGRSYPSDKLLNEKSFDLPFAQREYKISVKKLEQGLYAVTCGGVTIVAHWVNTGRGYLLTTNQQSHKVNISGDKDTLKVQLNGHLYEGIAHDPQKIKSAMTGSMWKVYVSPGDRVRVGDPIVNIEAMKMENVVVSEIDAKVKSVHVQSGDRVSPGGMMVELEPLDPNLVVEAKQAAIQLDSAGHVPLFDAEGLEKYLDKFSWEDRQKMLLGFIQGGGFFADSLIAVKGKKSPTQESTKKTSLSVILDAYRSEAALLEGEWKKLTKDDQDKILHAKHADLPEVLQTLSGKIRAHVSRIHDLLEQFLKLETPFQRLGDSFYTQNKDKAYQEALRRKNISIHIQTLMTLLRQVRDLPYHIKTHERSLVSYLAQMSQFKGEEFKGLRSLSRDLYRIANPRSQDNFNTSERVRQAAAAIDRDRREPLVESLLSAPILSATELVNLMQDSDENVRSVAAHVLLHRTYEGVRGDSQRTKRHQIVKGSFSVKDLEDGGDYCRWEFIDRKTSHRRLGVAVLANSQTSLNATIEKASLILAKERMVEGNSLEDAIEILVPPGSWPENPTEDVLKDINAILERCFVENKPKRITFSVWHIGKPTDYFSFTSEDGKKFVEQKRFRGLDPLRAHLLEMSRWVNFDTKKVPSDHRTIHSWVCEKMDSGQLDRRLTTRALVLDAGLEPGSSMPAFETVYREALEISQHDMDQVDRVSLKHLFFNVLTPINADFDSVSVALEKLVAQVQKEVKTRNHYKVEVKAEVRDPSSENGAYREVVFVFDLAGPSLRGKAYYVFGANHRKRIRWDIAESVGFVSKNFPADAIREMGVPYKAKSQLTLKREDRELKGRYYVYDRPDSLKKRLAEKWQAAGITMPPDAFEAVELAMVEGELQEVYRAPGENDRAVVAWKIRCRYPNEEGARVFYWASSDFTFEYGSVSPKEGELFAAVIEQRAIKEGRPFLVGAEGSGARILLDRSLIVEKADGTYHSYLQYDEAGHYLYLTEGDYNVAPSSHLASKNPNLSKLGDLVLGEWIERPLKNNPTQTERVYRVRTVLGGDGDLNTENLTQGSGRMAGAAQRAYDQIPTFALVTDTCVGIWTYIVRLVKRVAQCRRSPQLLTGKDSLNGLYGREVYADNDEIAGLNVMGPNGVTQFEAVDEDRGYDHFLNWLEFVPESKENPNEVRKPPADLTTRDVDRILLGAVKDGVRSGGVILDDAGKVTIYDPAKLIEALFDLNTFKEQGRRWAEGLVTGRAFLGGLPTGVIAFDPRTKNEMIPSDPGNPKRGRLEVGRPGAVWHAQAAYKTAQFLFDNEREGLPTIVLANVKGFAGGSFDLGPEAVTKYGAMIVEALQSVRQGRHVRMPVIILIPPYGETRGGAQVVIDSMINQSSVVVLMDENGEMSVLPVSGMMELSMMRKRLKAFDANTSPKTALGAVIAAHQTGERAELVGSVHRRVPTRSLRVTLHAELETALDNVAIMEEIEVARKKLRALAQIAGVDGDAALPDIVRGALSVIPEGNPYYNKVRTLIEKAQV